MRDVVVCDIVLDCKCPYFLLKSNQVSINESGLLAKARSKIASVLTATFKPTPCNKIMTGLLKGYKIFWSNPASLDSDRKK